ncbi:MAG: diguanylate cyclase [Acidimicrobiia bacterium]
MHWSNDPRRAALYAAYAFAVAGAITILGGLANADRFAKEGGSSTPILIAGAIALIAAGVIPMLPWARWNSRVTLVLPTLGLAILCMSELGSKSSRTADGAMGTATVVTLLFVWIGLTQPRWCSSLSAPIAGTALCLVFWAEGAPVSIVTLVTGVVLSAIIGELVAWVKHADAARSAELGLVIDGTSGLRNDTDRQAAAQRLADTVVALLHVPNVAVYLETNDDYRLTATTGDASWPDRRAVDAIGGLSVSAIDAGVELVIPLVGRAGGLRGVVVTAGRRRQDEFMLRLAQILGEQAGYRLDDLDAIDALTDENRRDALTGIGNRRFGDELLRGLRPRDVVAVVDLDDLRGINARSGHHGGDAAIRSVARYLSDAVRQVDAVARLGGDEFVMVLRDVGEDALVLVDRIAARWNLAHPGVTFSVGAAIFTGGDPEETLRTADDALFKAKRGGRARAHLAPSLTIGPPGAVRDASGF